MADAHLSSNKTVAVLSAFHIDRGAIALKAQAQSMNAIAVVVNYLTCCPHITKWVRVSALMWVVAESRLCRPLHSGIVQKRLLGGQCLRLHRYLWTLLRR